MDQVPRLDGLVVVGHVGHRAAGGHVGEDDLDRVGREHVGGLGHEVHAAEDDVFDGGAGLGAIFDHGGGELGELERVAEEVGVADDLVHLVVVPEDDEFLTELGAPGLDQLGELLVGELVIAVWE